MLQYPSYYSRSQDMNGDRTLFRFPVSNVILLWLFSGLSSAFVINQTGARRRLSPTCPLSASSAAPSRQRVKRIHRDNWAPPLDWRQKPRQCSRHVLFLEPEDRDRAFELLEAYIERESEAGVREDYDRVRGLVPHMRRRLWKAPSKEQDRAADELGMDDFQYATKEYLPGLTSHPWWDPEVFSWSRQLEEASPIIQEEYRALRAETTLFRNSKEGGYTSQGWTHIPLVNAREPAHFFTPQRAKFPKTMKILEDLGILSKARAVLIGRQQPMSGIKMHSDGSNVIITCHLGLEVPGKEQCLMWVGADMERREWINNKLLCMDTSYLHWTRNNTEKERIILMLMVWHPDITAKEQRVLEYLDCLIRTAVAGEPLPLEPPLSVEGAGF